MKLFDALRRHERLLWCLHSLYALLAGIAVMWFGARHFGFLRFVFVQIAFIWTSSQLLPIIDYQTRFGPRLRWWIRTVLNYLNKDFYQQLLFFVLPIYWASTTPDSLNVAFIVLLGVSAVLSTFDIVYDRHLAVRPTLLAVFFAFNLFACLNVALPVLWSIGNGTAMWGSGLLALVGFVTLRFRPPQWRRPRVLAVVALSGAIIAATILWGRPLIPPAPLRLADVTFGRAIQRRPLAIPQPISTLQANWSGRVYVLTSIWAPLGLKERVRQSWYRNGHLIFTSRYLEVTGGRTDGYRLWTSDRVTTAPGDTLRVDVQTEGGQLIGRANLRTGPAGAPASPAVASGSASAPVSAGGRRRGERGRPGLRR